MKKSAIYGFTIFLFLLAAGGIFFKYKKDEIKKENKLFPVLARKGSAAETEEFKAVQARSTALLNASKIKPDDVKTNMALATLYVQEARASGNYLYYDQAALKYVNAVLAKDPQNFEGLSIKALLMLSQHHFAEGLQIAEAAKKINPYNAFIYGLIIDGNVEMGNYTAAVENADKMVSLRPDIRSYSRISYLREIHGDYPGAIEAMQMAVSAGLPGDEGTEWSRVQLGRLYENTGDIKNAEMHYTIALQNRPAYAYAFAGLARVAAASKDFTKAAIYYLQADSLVNDYSIKEELSDVYKLAGEKEKAATLASAVINGMNAAAANEKRDDSSGHYSDRELAYAYLKTNQYDKALDHALLEYNRRPENIDVNETVAWVYYAKGDYAKAMPFANTALKTNSKNPALLCRIGLVYFKNGDKTTAEKLLKAGLAANPNIAMALKTESQQTLVSL
ncbi:MAG: tetratricopeptide repeat protein [Chitinophagaceae bacterium]